MAIDYSKYKLQPAPPAPSKPRGLGQRILDTATTVTNALGGKAVAETFGAEGAKLTTPKSAHQFIEQPSVSETAGSAIQLGAGLMPVGRLGQGIAAGAKVAGLGRASARIGTIGAGATTGYAFDAGANLQEGKNPLKPGVGTAIGAAIPGGAALGSVIKNTAQAQAPRIINSLIKPLSKQFSYGKDPGRTVAELGITANSLEDLATSISSARQTIGSNLRTLADQVPSRYRLQLTPALVPFDDAITKAVKNNDQALLNRLTEARSALTGVFKQGKDGKIVQTGSQLLDNLTYAQGVDFKRRVGELTKWTGQQTEDETVNGALTRAYALAKQQLDDIATKADPATAANLKKLNQQYADLQSAEIATKYRDVLQKRHNLINLPGKIGLAGSLVLAPFTGGVSTIIAAIASIGLDKALSSPAFKTRLAKWLSTAKPAEVAALKKAYKFPGDIFLDRASKKPL